MPAVISVMIAMGLLPILSIPHVLAKVAQGLRYVWPDPRMRLPGASALSQRRQQLGVRPMQVLFQRVCRPRATKETPGAFAFGLRLMAIDSTLEDVPDTFANALTFGRGASQHGPAPYQEVRGVSLQECGTHLIVDAIFGSCHHEPQAGFALLRSIQRGMLVLLDRGLHNALLIQLLRAMGAHVLGRLASNVIPQYARRLCAGTDLAYIYPQGAHTASTVGRPCWCEFSHRALLIPNELAMAKPIGWSPPCSIRARCQRRSSFSLIKRYWAPPPTASTISFCASAPWVASP